MNAHALPDKLENYTAGGTPFRETGKYVLFGIDSDGCVDRGMRAKHAGPFPRAGIEQFGLQPIAEAWRIAWSYVNEVEERGCPRFRGLARTVERVLEMPVVRQAEEHGVVRVPRLPHLRDYLKQVAEKKGYGDNVLEETIDGLPDGQQKDELRAVAEWSRKIHRYVASDCPYIEPFENAVRTITAAGNEGIDCMIVSGTPEDHLRETWQQHGLTQAIRGVFGRESGKKDVLLAGAMRAAEDRLGRFYDIAVMFGDAPGDEASRRKAAEQLGARIAFFPIRAGHEDDDWGWFAKNIMEKGDLDAYTEEVEAERIDAFRQNLDRKWDPETDITRLF